MARESAHKIAEYVAGGGVAVVTSQTLMKLGGVAGITVNCASLKRLAAGTLVTTTALNGKVSDRKEAAPLDACTISYPPDATVVASASDGKARTVLGVSLRVGRGMLLGLSSRGVAALPQVKLPVGTGAVDAPLPVSYPMLAHARALVMDVVASYGTPFTAGEGLSVVATRQSQGKYLLGISNSGLEQMPMQAPNPYPEPNANSSSNADRAAACS